MQRDNNQDIIKISGLTFCIGLMLTMYQGHDIRPYFVAFLAGAALLTAAIRSPSQATVIPFCALLTGYTLGYITKQGAEEMTTPSPS